MDPYSHRTHADDSFTSGHPVSDEAECKPTRGWVKPVSYGFFKPNGSSHWLVTKCKSTMRTDGHLFVPWGKPVHPPSSPSAYLATLHFRHLLSGLRLLHASTLQLPEQCYALPSRSHTLNHLESSKEKMRGPNSPHLQHLQRVQRAGQDSERARRRQQDQIITCTFFFLPPPSFPCRKITDTSWLASI